jgi:thioredoxin reductase (NADPH)
METFEGVAVVGSGIAGLTAAMYAARAGCATQVYEGDPFDGNDPPGGQLVLAERTDFIPGFPDGVDGPVLMANMREQAERLDVEFVPTQVAALARTGSGLSLTTEEDAVQPGAVVLATGARPRLPGVGEDAFMGRGVSLCAMCDAPLYKERDVVVLGGGDTAADEAILLARHARRVSVLHRGDRLDAHPRLAAELRGRANVEVMLGAEVIEVTGEGVVTGVRYRQADGSVEALPADGIFIAIGRLPNSALAQGLAELDADGYVVTDAGGATTAASLYACGECADPVFRQFASAVGSGCRAGMTAAAGLAGRS